MKRITMLTIVLTCGVFAASATAVAQTLPPPAPAPAPQTPAPDPAQAAEPEAVTDWFNGNVSLLLLGRENVASSKFEEYRVVPQGVSMPTFNLMGSQKGKDFALFGKNISQKDQRYTGFANAGWLGVSFDYNQIPHKMGNDAKTIHTETSEGVWNMNATARQALGAAVDATLPTEARTYAFYSNLLAPTIAAAEHSDLDALRKRGEITFDVGSLPFDLAVTYLRDVKTGYRGASAGDILGAVTSSVDVLEPLNEVTQDIGVHWAWNFNQNKSNVHAQFNRNTYNNRVNSLVVDNPFRATDLAYVSTSVPGGPAQARFSLQPDNEATRGAFGAQFKFARQTRLTADVAYGSWTQNDQFLPYTINSAISTFSGAPANSASSLQQQSLEGKISTASYNFTFHTRPVDPLAIRVRYRNYAYKDKSARFLSTGDTSGDPDRSFEAPPTPTTENPYGYPTANRTDSSNGHFETQVSYDIGALTLEGAYRNIQTSWKGRQESSGTDGNENGYSLAAVYNTTDWLNFRFQFNQAFRSVSGINPGTVADTQGVMSDHAKRDQTRIGFDVELTPADTYGVTFSYYRRDDDFPNRPFKVVGNPDTESGLLEASYDMYSVDFDYRPSARAELSAFYTFEKMAETNQWVTLSSGALNNILRYAPNDKGHTFGFNGLFHIVPDKWTLTALLQHQKIDGFLDITAREQGSFYTPGRTTLIPPGQGGAADITDYDDTRQTTFVTDLAYAFAKAWSFSFGYAYEKYDFADAYSDGTTIFPQSVLFFLKANDGPYSVNIGFTRLSYTW